MRENDIALLAANHATQIAVVAGLVWLVTRWWARDRPHLAHALWALVLLKSLMPPIIPSPFIWYTETLNASSTKHDTLAVSGPTKNSIQPKVSIRTGGRLPTPDDRIEIDAYVPPAMPNPASCVVWFLRFWAASSLGLLIYYAGQFIRFKGLVRKTSVNVPQGILGEVAQLRRQLGIRREVQVRVLDALIGPAVMGCLRPTLLLPKAIVRSVDSQQLRPLLAHELVHIRRGDLAWSTFQVISASLWWFHPAVWIANRLLVRESERSCDEETIASLGVNPATYARCLLTVLETKHKLIAAPLVPGLRPVDITSNRMERIMRIGHGSHSCTPRWVGPTLIIGSLMLLPGAAWLRAQERVGDESLPSKNLPQAPYSLSEDSQTGTSAGKTTAARATHQRLMMPTADGETFNNVLFMKLLVLDVPVDLVQELRSTDAANRPEVDSSITVNQLDSRGNVLHGTVDSDLGIAGQLTVQDSAFVVPASSSVPLAEPVKSGPWLVKQASLERIQEWCKHPAEKNIRIISRPTLTAHSGTRAICEIGAERPFVVGYEQDGSPTVETKKTGLLCGITATLVQRDLERADFAQPRGADFIHMACDITHSEIVRVDEFSFASEDGRTLSVQQPSIVSRKLDFSVNLPLGATFASTDGLTKTDDGLRTTLFLITVESDVKSEGPTSKDAIDVPSTMHAAKQVGPAGPHYAAIEPSDSKNSEVRLGDGHQASVYQHSPYRRASVVGPLRSQSDAPPLDPPTDEEFVAAYKQVRSDIPAWSSCRIIKELIADYVDPPRSIPLIGKASLHHRHYKCTIYYVHKGKQQVDVLYIDHNHFVMHED